MVHLIDAKGKIVHKTRVAKIGNKYCGNINSPVCWVVKGDRLQNTVYKNVTSIINAKGEWISPKFPGFKSVLADE